MDKLTEKKTSLTGLRIAVSTLLIFAGVMMYLPQSSVVRTLPAVLVFTAVADMVYRNVKFTLLCNGIFAFSILCAKGNEVAYSLVYTILSVFLSLLCIYGFRLLSAGNKTKNPELKKKCKTRSIIVLALSFAVYMLACGNIISCIVEKNANHSYIEKNYGNNVEIHYTAFDAISREYKTYVSFTDDGGTIGLTEDFYVSLSTDNVRDYYEDKLMKTGEKKLKTALMNAVDMFEITNSGFTLDKNVVIDSNSEFDTFADRGWYVVSLYHIVEEKNEFEKLVNDCRESLTDMAFSEIVICGGNANKVLFTSTLIKDSEGNTLTSEISEFDEKQMEKYGVTEMTVLDYWYNR